jgi:hypothetical protein
MRSHFGFINSLSASQANTRLEWATRQPAEQIESRIVPCTLPKSALRYLSWIGPNTHWRNLYSSSQP